jgi:hypothetical protein
MTLVQWQIVSDTAIPLARIIHNVNYTVKQSVNVCSHFHIFLSRSLRLSKCCLNVTKPGIKLRRQKTLKHSPKSRIIHEPVHSLSDPTKFGTIEVKHGTKQKE